MKKISDKEFIDFLVNQPLYSKIKAIEGMVSNSGTSFISYYDYYDRKFQHRCPYENTLQTFKTGIAKHSVPPSLVHYYIIEDEEALPTIFDEESKKMDITFHLAAECRSCGNYINYLLKVTSDKSWDERESGISIIIQKVGQFPAYDIDINKTLKKYLSDEDQVNYKRAKTCLSFSYGIGAYSYLRRVIENEIRRIIKDISELEFDGADSVKKAYNDFLNDHQMSKLIDVINTYLPLSLKELGDNPIRLLYEQLSGGIHQFTDEECVKKAQSIDVLLNYVIRKINEEKYQLNEVKSAMKNLRG